jgi:hypothetical protein
LRGEGGGEGLRAKCSIAVPVVAAFRVLSAIELDNQAPLAADKVDEISIDRLLPDKFVTAELPTAKACPQ